MNNTTPPEQNSTKILIETLISARWVIPVRPQQMIFEHHSIAINKGKIIAILPTEQALQQFHPTSHIELPLHALTPGLVNTHGHAAMSLLRGFADDYPLHEWLEQHIWPAEGQWVGEQFVKEGSQLAIIEMLRSGTTCYSDMYFFPESGAQAAIEAGIRAQFCLPIFDFATAWGTDADDYIHKGLMVKDSWQHHNNIHFVFGPHAPYTVGDETFNKITTLAAEMDIGIQIHCHETQKEVDDALATSGERPLSRLNRLGLLSPATQLVHMTALNDNDIALIKATGAHVIHCPQSNMKLASGLCPVQKLLDESINVALGTDGAASNNTLDLFSEMRSAALLAKVVSGNAAAVNDWQALEMATLSGAKALGLDDKIGSLEIGKQADIIAIDLSQIEQQPIYTPISQLIYTQCGQRVTDSWVAGNRVLNNRQPTQINTQRVLNNTQQWREKIRPNS